MYISHAIGYTTEKYHQSPFEETNTMQYMLLAHRIFRSKINNIVMNQLELFSC